MIAGTCTTAQVLMTVSYIDGSVRVSLSGTLCYMINKY